jgi:hypothetical protein
MPDLVRHDYWYKTDEIAEENDTEYASATGPAPALTTTLSETAWEPATDFAPA